MLQKSHTPIGQKTRDKRAIYLLITLLLAVVGVAFAISLQASSQVHTQAGEPPRVIGDLPSGDPDAAESFSANPAQVAGTNDESASLHNVEDYWLTRISYPTGKFSTTWVSQAAKQNEALQERTPAGTVTYNQGASPLTLDPNSWTSLGPQPEQSDGCINCYSYGHVSGRVNDIRIDPVDPTVAYIAPVGGGIWKTTNCCTTATTWTPVTDDPLISVVSVDDISIDPNNHNTVYVGTGDLNYGSFSMGSAGLLKSTDQGATWSIKGEDVFTPYYPEPAGQYPQYQSIGKVEADPNNSNTVIAGTKTGLFISYNGGDDWTGPCYTNSYSTQRQDVTGLLVTDSGSFSDMYVAIGTRGFSTTVQYSLAENGANGIYKAQIPTSGCPAGWNLVSTPSNGWPTGTGSGIPVYQAGGDTLGRVDLAMAPSNHDYVYAVVQAINPSGNRGGVLGVWRTTDAGTTWNMQAGPGNSSAEWQGCATAGTQNWYNQHIAVDPNDPNTVLVDTIDIFKSTNGADTLTNITCGYNGGRVHVDQHSLEYLPGSSSVLLTGSDGGVYLSTNANVTNPTFSPLNDSLNTIEFYSGDITGNFANASQPGANAGAQDNGSSVYQWPTNNVGPALWQLRKGGDGMYARIEPVLGLRWYQESQNGVLGVSQTGPYGSQVSATGGWGGDRLSFVFPYEIFKGNPAGPAAQDCPPTGCTHMIAGSYRVWETILGGIPSSSWHSNSPDLTKNTLADRSFINQLSYSVSMSTTAIVGTNDGNVQYGFNLGQATANSATWVNVTGGNAVLPNRPIQDVATDPVNPLIGYAAIGGFDQNTPSTPGHVYRVTCTAQCASYTWVNKSGNLPNIPINAINANPLYPQQVFAGSDWGVYYTDDITQATPTWYKFQTGMPSVMIWDFSIDRGFTTLAAFTRGRGSYVWPLPTGPIGATPTPSETPVVGTPTNTPTSTSVPPTDTGTPAPPTMTSTPTETVTGTPPTATETPTACTLSFEDVPPDHTFYASIHCLACQGIINGYPCGGPGEPCNGNNDPYFRPGNNVTRGQFAKIASNSAGFNDAAGPQQYEDVLPGSTFYDFIWRLTNRGLVNGYPCGGVGEPCGPTNLPYFRPNANVTRGQLSKIDANAAGLTQTPGAQQFEDVLPGSTFYDFIWRLTDLGYMNGYPCGGVGEPCGPNNLPYFRPSANATRGQASKIVSNTFFPTCNP
ncbi:MAG TPA: S-layer homology domain-containing protein [Chloroflexia bacterium]|nr:S-layer homology domain-containing protein [Chloroflexia bacterium]